MKAKLTLNNPLWQTAKRQAILDKAVQKSGAELESEIKRTILQANPAGRLYRRGRRTHRASRKGQPFASDTGGTLNATRSKKTGEMRNTVSNSKKHAKILDAKTGLDRPFFESVAEKFKPVFKQNIRDEIKENT